MAQTERTSRSWHLFTGGIAGGVSRTVTSPLQRLKILRQCQIPQYFHLTMWQSLKQFYTLQGYKGFFKGNGSNVIKIVPFSALEFYVFQICKKNFQKDDQPLSKLKLLACGSSAGIVASIATYPVDLARTILSINTDKEKHGILQQLSSVYKTKGFLGLYKGLWMSLLGIAPFIGVKMSSFQILKGKYLPNRDHKYFTTVNLTLGALAGTIACLLTYPTDLIRRKIQLIAFEPCPYTGIVDCCQYLHRTEGLQGFYRGMVPSLLKVAPAMAVVFATNEWLKKLLNVK